MFALCLSVATAAPQFFRTFNAAPAVAVPAATTTTLLRSQPVLTHAAPVVSVAQPAAAVHTIAHPVAAPAAIVRTSAPAVIVEEEPEEEEPVNLNPSYSYAYSVADETSGDSKTKEETMSNGAISGSYSVADPDGRLRLVTYTADKENGFQATVTYNGEAGPPAIPFDPPAAPTVVTRAHTATHAVHAVAAPTLVAAAPAATVVRTAAPEAIHAVHNVAQPALVHAAPATTVFRSAAIPTATHLTHF